MKKLLILLTAVLFCVITAQAQTGFTAVMVNSNGVVQRPTNFLTANGLGLSANTINNARSVTISPSQWGIITNNGGYIQVFDGSMAVNSAPTNSNASYATYAFGNQGPIFWNTDSGGQISLNNKSGMAFLGVLTGSRLNAIKRIVIRGMSSTNLIGNIGTSGLDRKGLAVETRIVGSNPNFTNEARLVIHASTGPVASSWVQLGTPNDKESFWVYIKDGNTYLAWANDSGAQYSNVITISNVPGGTTTVFSDLTFAVVNTNDTIGGSPYTSVMSIVETQDINP